MGRRERGRWDIPPAGETFTLTLEKLTHQGSALAHHEGQAVFVAFGIPGEVADVYIERVHKDYLEGRVVEVKTPSSHRVQPRCEYFGMCGGCQLQHIAYEEQLEQKRQIVIEQLRRIGKFQDVEVRPTVPSQPWHYRNHARFTVDREGYLGFTIRHRKRIVRTENCYIIDPWIRDTMQALQGRAEEMRQVAMRVGVNTGDTLIQPPLGERAPEIPSGQRAYTEKLLGEEFHVSAASFFQVNTPQAENLIRLVRDGLALGPDDVLLDAYAGVGTFAKTLAGQVRKVIAIEVSASSVADGKLNTEDVENIGWVLGEVEAVLPELRERPTAVVLDPSRQGCGVPTLEALIEAEVPRIAYVSCEPSTLARDLRILVDGGYTLDHVQPVDLFPQTYHIECVATLRREQGTGDRGQDETA
jgi:23S rRNA (uracil1939-C5)-methyltransferase